MAKKERIISAMNTRRRQAKKEARQRRDEAARIRREILPPRPASPEASTA